jgi:fatty acid desaturase
MKVGTNSRPSRSTRAKVIVALVALDFVLLLFPPLTWIVGGAAVWYFLIAGAVGVLSLMLMYLLDDSGEE